MEKDKQEIKEEVIDISEVTDVGGVASLQVENVTEPFKAKVITATAKKTAWGNRVDFYIEGEDGYGHNISSWNFCSRKKYTPNDLIGKNILLKPYNEKKLYLEVV